MSDNTAVRFPSHKGPRCGARKVVRLCLRQILRCSGLASSNTLYRSWCVCVRWVDGTADMPASSGQMFDRCVDRGSSCCTHVMSNRILVGVGAGETETQTERKRDTESDTLRKRGRAREKIKRQRDRETEKQRERERERKQTTFTSRGPSEGHAIVSDAELSMPQPAS